MGAHRAESRENRAEDDLTNHEEPAECAEELVLDEVFAALEDDVFVEAVWETFGWPVPEARHIRGGLYSVGRENTVPACGMNNSMSFALSDSTKTMSDPSPLGRRQEPMMDWGRERFWSRYSWPRGTDRRGVLCSTTGDGNARRPLRLVDAVCRIIGLQWG